MLCSTEPNAGFHQAQQVQWHSLTSLGLNASKPLAASQEVQYHAPAIPVLLPNKPSAVFKPRTVSQQGQYTGPAIPVPYPSKPGAMSQQSKCLPAQLSPPNQGRTLQWGTGVLAQALAGTGTIFWLGGEQPTLCQPPCHLHRGARKPCVWSCSLGINCAKCFICVETQLC